MLNLLNFETSNSLAVVQHLMHQLKLKANISTIKENLESHPEYPSLLAISDCLTSFKIKNYSYQIVKEDFDKADLTFPLITHTQMEGGKFILVQCIDTEGKFIISDEKGKNKGIEEHKFLENWNGIILNAEPDEKSGESNFNAKRIESLLHTYSLSIFSILMIIFATYLFKTNSFRWSILGLCITKLLGVIITGLLISNSINQNNSLVRKLCALGGKHNCNSLLNSAAARITTWLSWSELGFFYFSGTFLITLLFPVLTPLLQFLNIITIPFIIFSLSYQYRKKNWCILCCIVQSLFFTEFMIFTFSFDLLSLNTYLNASLFVPLLICFLVPVTLWYILKPILVKAASVSSLQWQLNRFKFDIDIFNRMLTVQKFLKLDDDLLPVTIGNQNVTHTITMISNPTCNPCKEAHNEIDELLAHRDDLKLQLLFINDDKENDYRTQISRHLIALGLIREGNNIVSAIHDLYEEKDFESWAAKYPATVTDDARLANNKQKNWFKSAGILYTPTILINGYLLPAPYRIEDLKYLLN